MNRHRANLTEHTRRNNHNDSSYMPSSPTANQRLPARSSHRTTTRPSAQKQVRRHSGTPKRPPSRYYAAQKAGIQNTQLPPQSSGGNMMTIDDAHMQVAKLQYTVLKDLKKSVDILNISLRDILTHHSQSRVENSAGFSKVADSVVEITKNSTEQIVNNLKTLSLSNRNEDEHNCKLKKVS